MMNQRGFSDLKPLILFLKHSLHKVTYGIWMTVNVGLYFLKGTSNYLKGHEKD